MFTLNVNKIKHSFTSNCNYLFKYNTLNKVSGLKSGKFAMSRSTKLVDVEIAISKSTICVDNEMVKIDWGR